MFFIISLIMLYTYTIDAVLLLYAVRISRCVSYAVYNNIIAVAVVIAVVVVVGVFLSLSWCWPRRALTCVALENMPRKIVSIESA